MSLLAALLIWLLPGSVFCLHQGIVHARGKHIPQVHVFGWVMPHWLIYLLVLITGPIMLTAMLFQIIASSER